MELIAETDENILEKYIKNQIETTPFSSFLFGFKGRVDVDTIMFELLKNTSFELKKKEGGFLFWTLVFNNSVSRTFLDSKFNAIYHKKFGEGLKGCNPKVKNATCISYFVRTDKDKLIHFYIDNRGTSMEVQDNFLDDEIEDFIKWFTINKIEFCPDELKPYHEMVNKIK